MPEFAIALIAGLPLGLLIARISHRAGLLDRPGAIKPHARPIPYTGGAMIALLLAVIAPFVGVPVPAIGGLLIAWAIGVVDDVWGLRPVPKLVLLIPALLLGSLAVDLQVWERGVAIGIGVVLLNAFNVIDGLDGLAGGSAALTLVALVFVPDPWSGLASAALGSVVAFLALNLPPARLFLGDQGSLLLGYVLWLLSLALLDAVPGWNGLAIAIGLWLFPMVNAAFVLATRLRERRPLLVGDRAHLYDVLNRRLGLRATLAACWGIAGLGAILAGAAR